jgi:hypothetical protein
MNVFVSLRLDSCGSQLGTKFWVMRDGKVACVKWMKHRARVLSIDVVCVCVCVGGGVKTPLSA